MQDEEWLFREWFHCISIGNGCLARDKLKELRDPSDGILVGRGRKNLGMEQEKEGCAGCGNPCKPRNAFRAGKGSWRCFPWEGQDKREIGDS